MKFTSAAFFTALLSVLLVTVNAAPFDPVAREPNLQPESLSARGRVDSSTAFKREPLDHTKREPDVIMREPGLSQERSLDSREPGVRREPGLASREPGLASREPGFASREPGLASREPGLASREPGLASREPAFDTI